MAVFVRLALAPSPLVEDAPIRYVYVNPDHVVMLADGPKYVGAVSLETTHVHLAAPGWEPFIVNGSASEIRRLLDEEADCW